MIRQAVEIYTKHGKKEALAYLQKFPLWFKQRKRIIDVLNREINKKERVEK